MIDIYAVVMKRHHATLPCRFGGSTPTLPHQRCLFEHFFDAIEMCKKRGGKCD